MSPSSPRWSKGDRARAEALMAEHLANVQAALRLPALTDPLDQLRSALAPLPQPDSESQRPSRRLS